MDDRYLCPPDEDSGLSITSNITGIMTFCVAVILGAWLRFHTWTSAEREFEEFEKHIKMHKIELNWMRDLLSETALDGPSKHATRPLPIGHISSGRPLSPTLEREHPRDRYIDKPLNSLSWRDKWRKIAYAAIKRSRNDRAVIEAVQQEIRCSRMKKKRDRRQSIAERDRNLFGRIFKMIDRLDRDLQTIVDSVRRRPEKGKDLLMYRSAFPGYVPSERYNPRASILLNEGVDHEESQANGIEPAERINSAPQLTRATQLYGDTGHRRRILSEGSLDVPQHQEQNFVLQPIHTVLSRRNQAPHHIENGVRLTSELGIAQSPAPPPGDTGAANPSPLEQVATAANGTALAAPAVAFRTPQDFRDANPLDSPKEPKLPRSFTSRVADHIQSNFPESWFSKYYVAWNWLRKREEALKLRKERDIQWNRVHASQLALLTRRIEDQDEQLDLLDFHITLHNRLISRASWTRARR